MAPKNKIICKMNPIGLSKNNSPDDINKNKLPPKNPLLRTLYLIYFCVCIILKQNTDI